MSRRFGVFLCVCTFALSVGISWSTVREKCVRLESGQTVMRSVSGWRFVYRGAECLPGYNEFFVE